MVDADKQNALADVYETLNPRLGSLREQKYALWTARRISQSQPAL